MAADFRIISAVASSAGPEPLLVEDGPDAGQLVGGLVPGPHDGGAQVHGLGHLLALDPAGEAGVPLQQEGGEEVEIVGERGRDAIDVAGQDAVAALVGRGDDIAKHVSTTVEGRPGHGLVLSLVPARGVSRVFTYREYVPRVRTIPSVCQRSASDADHPLAVRTLAIPPVGPYTPGMPKSVPV